MPCRFNIQHAINDGEKVLEPYNYGYCETENGEKNFT